MGETPQRGTRKRSRPLGTGSSSSSSRGGGAPHPPQAASPAGGLSGSSSGGGGGVGVHPAALVVAEDRGRNAGCHDHGGAPTPSQPRRRSLSAAQNSEAARREARTAAGSGGAVRQSSGSGGRPRGGGVGNCRTGKGVDPGAARRAVSKGNRAQVVQRERLRREPEQQQQRQRQRQEGEEQEEQRSAGVEENSKRRSEQSCSSASTQRQRAAREQQTRSRAANSAGSRNGAREALSKSASVLASAYDSLRRVSPFTAGPSEATATATATATAEEDDLELELASAVSSGGRDSAELFDRDQLDAVFDAHRDQLGQQLLSHPSSLQQQPQPQYSLQQQQQQQQQQQELDSRPSSVYQHELLLGATPGERPNLILQETLTSTGASSNLNHNNSNGSGSGNPKEFLGHHPSNSEVRNNSNNAKSQTRGSSNNLNKHSQSGSRNAGNTAVQNTTSARRQQKPSSSNYQVNYQATPNSRKESESGSVRSSNTSRPQAPGDNKSGSLNSVASSPSANTRGSETRASSVTSYTTLLKPASRAAAQAASKKRRRRRRTTTTSESSDSSKGSASSSGRSTKRTPGTTYSVVALASELGEIETSSGFSGDKIEHQYINSSNAGLTGGGAFSVEAKVNLGKSRGINHSKTVRGAVLETSSIQHNESAYSNPETATTMAVGDIEPGWIRMNDASETNSRVHQPRLHHTQHMQPHHDHPHPHQPRQYHNNQNHLNQGMSGYGPAPSSNNRSVSDDRYENTSSQSANRQSYYPNSNVEDDYCDVDEEIDPDSELRHLNLFLREAFEPASAQASYGSHYQQPHTSQSPSQPSVPLHSQRQRQSSGAASAATATTATMVTPVTQPRRGTTAASQRGSQSQPSSSASMSSSSSVVSSSWSGSINDDAHASNRVSSQISIRGQRQQRQQQGEEYSSPNPAMTPQQYSTYPLQQQQQQRFPSDPPTSYQPEDRMRQSKLSPSVRNVGGLQGGDINESLEGGSQMEHQSRHMPQPQRHLNEDDDNDEEAQNSDIDQLAPSRMSTDTHPVSNAYGPAAISEVIQPQHQHQHLPPSRVASSSASSTHSHAASSVTNDSASRADSQYTSSRRKVQPQHNLDADQYQPPHQRKRLHEPGVRGQSREHLAPNQQVEYPSPASQQISDTPKDYSSSNQQQPSPLQPNVSPIGGKPSLSYERHQQHMMQQQQPQPYWPPHPGFHPHAAAVAAYHHMPHYPYPPPHLAMHYHPHMQQTPWPHGHMAPPHAHGHFQPMPGMIVPPNAAQPGKRPRYAMEGGAPVGAEHAIQQQPLPRRETSSASDAEVAFARNAAVSDKPGADTDDGAEGASATKVFYRRAWTDEEDKTLIRAVQDMGPKHWAKVADLIPGKTANQCSQRWLKALHPDIRKGKWTMEEDENLRKAVAEHGKKWRVVATIIPGRTGKQCRDRYLSRLDPELKNGPWTSDEDKLVLDAHARHGNRWATIQKELPHRSWYTIKWRIESLKRGTASTSSQLQE